jgi:hypothetical protein
MALYFSAHATACLTKQAIRELMLKIVNAREVNVRRCVASQIGGRILTEIEAPDQFTLEKFFQSMFIKYEWIMRIELDAHDGAVTEY